MCWVRVSVLGVGVGECAGCGCGRVCWVCITRDCVLMKAS